MTRGALLNRVAQNADEHLERVQKAVAPLSETELNRRPTRDCWSPAEILSHLLLANRYYLRVMRASIAKGHKLGGDPEVRYSWFAKLIMKHSGPGGNAPVPPSLRPNRGPYGREVLNDWEAQQAGIIEMIESARGIDLMRSRIRNPFLPLLTMSLADCFATLDSHTERHVQQIEERSRVASA
jgi:hypothetical protein